MIPQERVLERTVLTIAGSTNCRQSHDRIQRIIEQVVNAQVQPVVNTVGGNIVRVRGQTNDQTRRPRSEGGAAEDHQEHHAEKRIHLEK